MPFKTEYAKNINNQLNQLYRKHIDNEDKINDNERKDKHEIVGELEHLTTTKKQLHGGSHEDTTLHDLGYEKTLNDEVRPVRKFKPKITEEQLINGQGLGGILVGEGMSAGGMSAGAMSGCGMSAGSKPKKARRKTAALVVAAPIEEEPTDKPMDIQSDDIGAGVSGGGLSAGGKAKKPRKTRTKKTGGDLKDVLDTAASVAKTVAPFAPLLLGLGHEDGHKKRSEIVKEVMNEKKLSLIEASKYVKEHGLYKGKQAEHSEPKEKKKSERSAIVKKIMEEKNMSLIDASKYVKEHGLYKPKMKGGTLLSLKSVDTLVGDTVGPVSIQAGGVKPLKGRGKAKSKSTT